MGRRVSHRHSFIPASSVVEPLLAEGWNVTAARRQRVLLQDRKEFTRRILRFRRNDCLTLHVGDVFPEVVLLNSHDRGSAYQMYAGLYRLVCSNGLVVDDGTFARLSISHTGKVLDDVRKEADDIVQEVPRILGEVRDMQGIALTREERFVLQGQPCPLNSMQPYLSTHLKSSHPGAEATTRPICGPRSTLLRRI